MAFRGAQLCNLFKKAPLFQHFHPFASKLSNSNPTFSSSFRFSHQRAIKCWQCGIERQRLADLFCEQCNYIQGPREKDNYFKVFDLEDSFEIDAKALTQKYRNLQSVLHPDKFTNKSSQEKDISEDYSSLVNKAYDVLQTPLKRAVHLLGLKGAVIEEGQRVEDPEFLLEIMELNEEVENADDSEKLRRLHGNNAKMLEKFTKEINEAFRDDNIEGAKEGIIKMKYYASVSNHINALMREKGIVD